MATASLIELKEIAEEIRVCIEENLPSMGIVFEEFPRGSCGDASLILGTYYFQNGFGEFVYVSGEYYNESSQTIGTHAWLKKGSIIIDITADQFKDQECCVIVETSSKWHEKFTVVAEHPAEIAYFTGNPFAFHLLRAGYEIVSNCMQKKRQ